MQEPRRIALRLPAIRGWVFWPSLYALRLATRLYFRASVSGRDHYPAGPFVGVLNHSSSLDVPVMALALTRPAHFLAKAELFRVPVLGRWLGAVGGIPVHRGRQDQAAMEAAAAALALGRPLFVTPEGTRRHAADGSARPRTGFVRLAQQARCPVVPVAVAGVRRAKPPGARVPRPCKLRVQVGQPIHLEPIEVVVANHAALQRQAQEVMDVVYGMKAEMDLLDA